MVSFSQRVGTGVQHGAVLGHTAHKDEGHGLALVECHAVHAHHPQVLLLELHGPQRPHGPSTTSTPAPAAPAGLPPPGPPQASCRQVPSATTGTCWSPREGPPTSDSMQRLPSGASGRTGGVLISFSHVLRQVFSAPLIEEPVFSPLCMFAPSSKIRCPLVCGFISELSTLLHWSMFLLLCEYHAVLITVTL